MAFIPTGPDVVVPPTGAGGTPSPGDVCPQGWEEDFDRAAMTTEVLIARQQPTNVPDLHYNFPGANPPTTGQLTLNAAQSEATMMAVSKTGSDGADATIWLRYLKDDDSVRFADSDDTGTSLAYRLTAAPVEYPTYFVLPIVWQDGQTPVPSGGATLSLSLLAEPPELYIDTMGRNLYGHQTMSRTDLINTSKALFETLADRILEVRGVNSVPRVEAVTIDARTGHGTQNMELMSSAAPERPSRYRMRLAVDERPIFDRMCFVAGVRHFIARDEWTLRISLDIAEWAAQL